ncbi:hypothetical protein NB717_000076 [Xanthomonas sacchari]|uniref:hypothetical protein n=1 Tax=Xanthomonas sacchari TaxID=56458 RepID=UPI00225DF7D3|nr:hypothetical protein [Xanthomonas sacchari]MCW0459008.1 hypothetical protein [Xanthomonas sacchari]
MSRILELLKEQGVYLLGYGLDAIVQRNLPELPTDSLAQEAALAAHMLGEPAISPAARLRRYEEACKAVRDRHHDLRVQFGNNYKRSWAKKKHPPLQQGAQIVSLIDRKLRQC